MGLDTTTLEKLAERLDRAEERHEAIEKLTDDYPEMSWDDAYDIQRALRARKEARGTRIVGVKAGLTSDAKMRQMGVNEPTMGFLTDYGSIPDGGVIDTSCLIHPRVEAEIAFVLRHALRGPGCHVGAVLAATDFILPAAEIIDSRYRAFRFDLKSVIADNNSAARFVTGGAARKITGLDLPNLGIVMEKNGEIVATAAGSAVLGHPASAVAMLANMAASRGEEIPAGALIMTGGATEAVSVAAGDHINIKFQYLGSVSVRFE